MKYYYENKQEDSIRFKEGKLSASTYSYEISSYGYLELSNEETKKLYEAMKEYYEKELLK